MSSFVLFIIALFHDIHGTSERNGVLVANFTEMKVMNKNIPVIITNSPMSSWTLYEKLISREIYIENNSYITLTQQANCSCFGRYGIDNITICKQIVSSFLYRRREDDGYLFWMKYERESIRSCVVANDNNDIQLPIREVIPKNNTYYGLDKNRSNDYYKTNNYTKFYTYFNIAGDIGIFGNYIDHISLTPFFKLFNITRGYLDMNSLHIFIGNYYYRTMRHFDTPDNLFFMLNGSRRFKLSEPTYSLFNVYPFVHPSGRQQYPYYPFLQNNNNYQSDNINYTIFDIELYENEVLFIPGHWLHEVVNSNFSVAINFWWLNKDNKVEQVMRSYTKFPIDIDSDDIITSLTADDIDEFLYFIQKIIDEFCKLIIKHKDKDKYSMKCTDVKYNGYAYLLQSYSKIYPILNEINYNNFEWISLEISISNLFKCVQAKKEASKWINVDVLVKNFRDDTYYCFDIGTDYEIIWNKVIEEILNEYLSRMS
eukprot:208406_1